MCKGAVIYSSFSILRIATDDLGICLQGRAVVVMRRSSTASCQAGLTVNRVLLGQSTWNATSDACSYSWGHQSQLWAEFGAVYNGSCKPQSCQKQKDNYSTAFRANWNDLYFKTVSILQSLIVILLLQETRRPIFSWAAAQSWYERRVVCMETN